MVKCAASTQLVVPRAVWPARRDPGVLCLLRAAKKEGSADRGADRPSARRSAVQCSAVQCSAVQHKTQQIDTEEPYLGRARVNPPGQPGIDGWTNPDTWEHIGTWPDTDTWPDTWFLQL
jgi:hypothetical protein